MKYLAWLGILFVTAFAAVALGLLLPDWKTAIAFSIGYFAGLLIAGLDLVPGWTRP